MDWACFVLFPACRGGHDSWTAPPAGAHNLPLGSSAGASCQGPPSRNSILISYAYRSAHPLGAQEVHISPSQCAHHTHTHTHTRCKNPNTRPRAGSQARSQARAWGIWTSQQAIHKRVSNTTHGSRSHRTGSFGRVRTSHSTWCNCGVRYHRGRGSQTVYYQILTNIKTSAGPTLSDQLLESKEGCRWMYVPHPCKLQGTVNPTVSTVGV